MKVAGGTTSVMAVVAVPLAIEAPLGADSVRVTASPASGVTASVANGTTTVCVVVPAAKVSVPVSAVPAPKSAAVAVVAPKPSV